MTIGVGVIGGSGYIGAELLRYLCVHPETEILWVTANSKAGRPVREILPNLEGFVEHEFVKIEELPEDLGGARVVFVAVPHNKSQEVIPELASKHTDVVFIDPFAGGALLDSTGATERYRHLFGPEAELEPAMLAPVGVPAIVSRVLNNLVRTYHERDQTKLDRLLDLRVQLPGPPQERMLLVRIAESRGRWDLAARVREEVDPDDPEARDLRARLN